MPNRIHDDSGVKTMVLRDSTESETYVVLQRSIDGDPLAVLTDGGDLLIAEDSDDHALEYFGVFD